ncbi:MAG TPA: hypothetical protein QGH10_14810 [Armatimonadota bacterium]|nr:hypothetical protein [Armatimonadota bacterium]
MAPQNPRRTLAGRLVWLTAIGIAFGHIEAACVVYIRHFMDWVPLPGDLGPEMLAELPGWLIVTEQTREMATILMLLAVAALVGRNPLEKIATFLFAFGVWDIVYYIALRVMIGWPESLATMDCLFLIPKAWFAPVWIPMCAALVMVAIGAVMMASIEKYSAKYGGVGG